MTPRPRASLAGLRAQVDRWRRYARYFWCKAIPIYEPRNVVDLRLAAIRAGCGDLL